VRKLTIEEFINRANHIHQDKYDYSLIKEYKGKRSNIEIICPKHGRFSQIAHDHINGSGCCKCKNLTRYSTSEWTEKAKEVHGNKYDYSLVNYINRRTKVTIICSSHGEFGQDPTMHLIGNGCPICNESKGELEIKKYLNTYNINYESQKRFNDCRNKLPLPFDFYLPDYNICIEFDGVQHFYPYSFGLDKTDQIKLENLKEQKEKDMIKTQYCLNNNIKLIRIPYWKINNIEKALNRELDYGR
jgi:hypothetical protein